MEKARETEPWCRFRKIREIDFSEADEIKDDTTNRLIEVYDINGLYIGDSTERLTKGIYIVRNGVSAVKICR